MTMSVTISPMTLRTSLWFVRQLHLDSVNAHHCLIVFPKMIHAVAYRLTPRRTLSLIHSGHHTARVDPESIMVYAVREIQITMADSVPDPFTNLAPQPITDRLPGIFLPRLECLMSTASLMGY
jgi:hypothetical protein